MEEGDTNTKKKTANICWAWSETNIISANNQLDLRVNSWKVDPRRKWWHIGQIQFGAIKGRSTSHALVDIMHNSMVQYRALDERVIRVVFIDYAKAFDHVDHLT